MAANRRIILGLRSSDAKERLAAAEMLQRMGMAARFAAAPLVRVCADRDESVREAATSALEDLGPPDPEDCATLAEMLESPQADVVYWSATLLGRAGADSREYTDALRGVVVEAAAPREVLDRVVWALTQIDSTLAPRALAKSSTSAMD